jgi:hypothetical protein
MLTRRLTVSKNSSWLSCNESKTQIGDACGTASRAACAGRHHQRKLRHASKGYPSSQQDAPPPGWGRASAHAHVDLLKADGVLKAPARFPPVEVENLVKLVDWLQKAAHLDPYLGHH